MTSEDFIDASDDDLIEELTRRFPAIVYAMHRDSLAVGTGFDGKVGWDGQWRFGWGLQTPCKRL